MRWKPVLTLYETIDIKTYHIYKASDQTEAQMHTFHSSDAESKKKNSTILNKSYRRRKMISPADLRMKAVDTVASSIIHS